MEGFHRSPGWGLAFSGKYESADEKTAHAGMPAGSETSGREKTRTRSCNTMPGFTYILASKPYGTLYIGVTNNLRRRLSEHRSPQNRGFSGRYAVHRLVWYEAFDDIRDAIDREKQLKKWYRSWKIALIEEVNPKWEDLAEDLL
ncbi:MAG: GIY-YIG nuclease family protein [Rhodothermales bacterium]